MTEKTAFSHGCFVNGYGKDATFKMAAKARDYAECYRKNIAQTTRQALMMKNMQKKQGDGE